MYRCTVQITLHLLGYSWRSVRKSIEIRNVNKKKRILWCRGKLHWTVNNQWRKVVYSDEMMIVIKPDGKLKVEKHLKSGDRNVWAILPMSHLQILR